jgi:hypothetical protein
MYMCDTGAKLDGVVAEGCNTGRNVCTGGGNGLVGRYKEIVDNYR